LAPRAFAAISFRGDLVVMISSGLGWNQAAAAFRMTM
jgi:hypothetical protein